MMLRWMTIVRPEVAMKNFSTRRTTFLTGFFGGGFAGLMGVGGGVVLVPLLTGVLKMNQHTAQGTSLVVVIFAAGTGLITYAFTGYVAWDFVGLLLCGSLIGAYLGARVVQRFPEDALRLIFGLFLLLLALRFLIWTSLPPLIESSGTIEIVAGIAIVFVGGFAAGVLGIGGGAIFVPALVIVLGTDQHIAQGTSLGAVLATSAAAAFVYRRAGNSDIKSGKWIAVGAVPAGIAGALLAGFLSPEVLQRIFGSVILIVGLHRLAITSGLVAVIKDFKK